MIGPNHVATLPVPRLWTEKSAMMMASLMGRTKGVDAGVISSRPSTADRIEIAGVIIASP